ncbi:hypothetical protein D3C71_1656070 [compost metagenome]
MACLRAASALASSVFNRSPSFCKSSGSVFKDFHEAVACARCADASCDGAVNSSGVVRNVTGLSSQVSSGSTTSRARPSVGAAAPGAFRAIAVVGVLFAFMSDSRAGGLFGDFTGADKSAGGLGASFGSRALARESERLSALFDAGCDEPAAEATPIALGRRAMSTGDADE